MRKAAMFVGYAIWIAFLLRILFIAAAEPYTKPNEVIGTTLGLALALFVFSLAPYFIARHRAKKSGTSISWPYVMAGTTMIALFLSVGGFYGRLHATATATAAAPAVVVPAGWDDVDTGTDIIDPYRTVPQGASMYRAQDGHIHYLVPPQAAVTTRPPEQPEEGPWTEYQRAKNPQPTQSSSQEQLPYERRAWSGNPFDQFDDVQAIEAKARGYSQLNDQRAWAAVIAWQAYFMNSGNKPANVSLYMGVDSVLEGLKSNRGICRPGQLVTVDAAHSSERVPAGTQLVLDDCDRGP